MQIIERGTGTPLVLIPPLPGRWEYVRPAVEALAESFHVITFSLCDEPSSDAPFDPARGIENYREQVLAVLNQLAVPRAVVLGISFGGVVALRFAAEHPDRTSALVLASAPGPHWRLRRRHEIYARVPWIFGPLFLAEAPWRLRRELSAALPRRSDSWAFTAEQVRTYLRAPISARRMAARARLIGRTPRAEDGARVAVPTLVVHGEPHLDHVVPVQGTVAYGELIRGARVRLLEKTGHLGTNMRPREFAALVRDFLAETTEESPSSAA
ncbi:MAG TPA: alpha/beta hydrolase [Vicinamibacterales bacterium]